MTIVSYDDLRGWFYGNSRKGTPAPYWSLFGQSYAVKDYLIVRNDVNPNIDEAFAWLQESIKRVNNPEGQRFRIIQVDQPGGNNPVGQVFVQIGNTGQSMAGINGIGQIQQGIGATEVAEMISKEREKWEMANRIKELEAQLAAPQDDILERGAQYLERFGKTPLGAALVSKITGIPFAEIAGIGNPGGDEEISPDDNKFYDNMSEVARTLGTNEHQLAHKLRRLVEQNPEMAKQLFNS